MKLSFHLAIMLWVGLSIIFGLLTAIVKNREDMAYRQVMIWFVSPFIAIAGLVFIDRGRKKRYYRRLKNHLFIKK